MREAEIVQSVQEFIRENFLYMKPDFELGPDDKLLERGIIDSMGVVELLAFIEDRYAVRANDDEITEENLGTLNAIARFVSARTGADQQRAS